MRPRNLSHRTPTSQLESKLERCSTRVDNLKHSYYKEQISDSYQSMSLLREIQEMEKVYSAKMRLMQQQNQKLMMRVEYLENTIEQTKQLLFEKQLQINALNNRIVNKQQTEIGCLKMLVAEINNSKYLRTEIDDERIKTERLRKDVEKMKTLVTEKPLENLFKRLEWAQQQSTAQNQELMQSLQQVLGRPNSGVKSSSLHRRKF